MAIPVTVDFETEAIEGNPILHPPRPVGVAIYADGTIPEYYPISAEITDYLARLWADCDLLFHNAPFDLSVARRWLGLEFPPWDRVHDTMYLVYLAAPYAATLSLKPSAERYLDLPPEEQDELRDWILANVGPANKRNWGAYICEAPYEVVRPYAIGDVVRTRGLFDYLHPTQPREAYDRERKLMPTLVEATRRGVRLDRERLEADLPIYIENLNRADEALRLRLDSPNLNPNSPTELAEALDRVGAVTEWSYTPTGRKCTAKKKLLGAISDPEVLSLLLYRSSLETCLGTFMTSWLAKSEGDGRLHPNWNQIRSTEGKRKGTRTGRLSSDDPNFQNVPTEFEFAIPEGLPPLPFMRQYILPEEGHIWLKRDFSSQEIRILGHYEDDTLMRAYQENPALDPHEMAKGIMEANTSMEFVRKHVKITAFLMVYGGGIPALSEQLGCTNHEAGLIRSAYLDAIPGIRKMQKATQAVGRADQPIKTWGGRYYFREPSKIVQGRMRDFSYKLLNYLIQGSAADQTKQCINDWEDTREPDDVFMATVHDEVNISAPIDDAYGAMRRLKLAMDQPLFDVPFQSEGFAGPNWHDIKESS